METAHSQKGLQWHKSLKQQVPTYNYPKPYTSYLKAKIPTWQFPVQVP